MDVEGLYRRSRLPEGAKNRIVALLSEDPGMGMKAVADRTGLTYSQVRTAFGYLGLTGLQEAQSEAHRAERRKHRERLEALAAQGCTQRQMSERLGLPTNTVRKACREMGIVAALPEHPHGSDRRYVTGCRCVECVSGNTERKGRWLRERRSEDAPHGTPSGYRNWGCRCTPCREAGSADQTERTAKSPQHELNLYRDWTPDEDMVALDFSLTAREVADLLGRSVTSVNSRRSGHFKLVKVEDVKRHVERFKAKSLSGSL